MPIWLYGDNGGFLIIMIAAMILGGLTQAYISRMYKKWSRVQISSRISGKEAAQRILEKNNIGTASAKPVVITRVQGKLSDHFDPRTNTVALSSDVYDNPSVSGVAVAAHEVGHAIQHAQGYFWSNLRTTFVPVVNFGSSMAGILILMGLLINISGLFWAGIIAYGSAVAFQIITLPVEINASRRALVQLRETGIVTTNEEAGARQVLTAAALTYLASALISLMYLLYYIGLRRD